MRHYESQDFHYLLSEKVYQYFVMVVVAENMIFAVLSELLLPAYYYLSPGVAFQFALLDLDFTVWIYSSECLQEIVSSSTKRRNK